jgi:hypothetical protein
MDFRLWEAVRWTTVWQLGKWRSGGGAQVVKRLCGDLNVNIASITSTVGLGSTASNGVGSGRRIQQLK